MGLLLGTLRWKQWTKNLLVFAPFFAVGFSDERTFGNLTLGFIAFSFLSSAIYILNDLQDVNEDAKHPIKSKRPIAAGKVSRSLAFGIALALLFSSALIVAIGLNGQGLQWLGIYFFTSLLYVYFFRNIFLLDLYFLSAGFIFRVLFGGAIASIPISSWLLVVIGSFSFFVASGKRLSEIESGNAIHSRRTTLSTYSPDFLKQVIFSSLSLTLVAYSLWTIEGASSDSIALLSVVPFSYVMFRYLFNILRGVAEAPELVLFSDRAIQVASIAWILTYSLRFV